MLDDVAAVGPVSVELVRLLTSTRDCATKHLPIQILPQPTHQQQSMLPSRKTDLHQTEKKLYTDHFTPTSEQLSPSNNTTSNIAPRSRKNSAKGRKTTSQTFQRQKELRAQLAPRLATKSRCFEPRRSTARCAQRGMVFTK